MAIEFVVQGKPATAGNKRGMPFKRKSGKLGVRMIEGRDKKAVEHSLNWRNMAAAVGVAAANRAGGMILGPVQVCIVYLVPRPAGHWKKNGSLSLEGQRNPFPASKPDLTKWTRALEDALKGIAWEDDARIVDERHTKLYQPQRGMDFSTLVRIRPAPAALNFLGASLWPDEQVKALLVRGA